MTILSLFLCCLIPTLYLVHNKGTVSLAAVLGAPKNTGSARTIVQPEKNSTPGICTPTPLIGAALRLIYDTRHEITCRGYRHRYPTHRNIGGKSFGRASFYVRKLFLPHTRRTRYDNFCRFDNFCGKLGSVAFASL